MLLDLPPELLLSILKHLSVSDIATCCATSSTFKTFIDEYEDTVYRQAAAHPSLHLIPHDQILFPDVYSLNRHSRRFLAGTDNWKDFCRRACEVRSSWLGRGPSRITSYDCGSSGSAVHRIKVDEKRRFYITTHLTGGLTVADIDEGKVIWGLKPYYVRGLAHCEYGEGFLIFDRSTFWHGGHGVDGKEVWRLVSEEAEPGAPDPDELEVVPESRPDNFQLDPMHSYSSTGRLKFVPHAFLRPPANAHTRAFRFVYPTLLMGGEDSLFLWDVRTGKLVERMDDIQRQVPRSANENSESRVTTADEKVPTNSEQGMVVASENPAASENDIEISDEGDDEDEDEDDSEDEDEELAEADWQLLQTYQLHQPQMPEAEEKELGDICYVEVNPKYTFVCGTESLKVFRRRAINIDANHCSSASNNESPRTAECVLALTETQLWRRGAWYFRVGYVVPEDLPDGFKPWQERRDGDFVPGTWRNSDRVVVRHSTILSRVDSTSPTLGPQLQYCSAVHSSSCGQHLAILVAETSRLLIIPYFERVIDGRVEDPRDIMIDIQLNTLAESVYLAYEDGRISAITQLGVFIIYPTFAPPDDLETPPQVQVLRVPLLNNPESLTSASCLQLSSTALWLTWNTPLYLEEAEEESRTYEEIFERSFDTGAASLFMSRRPHRSFVTSVDFGVEPSGPLTRYLPPMMTSVL